MAGSRRCNDGNAAAGPSGLDVAMEDSDGQVNIAIDKLADIKYYQHVEQQSSGGSKVC